MKKPVYLLFLIGLFFMIQINLGYSQDSSINEAEFPGGRDALSKYIKEHFNCPEAEKKKPIKGSIALMLLIDSSGKVSDVKFMQRIIESSVLNDEAKKMALTMPLWIPATVGGVRQNGNVILNINPKDIGINTVSLHASNKKRAPGEPQAVVLSVFPESIQEIDAMPQYKSGFQDINFSLLDNFTYPQNPENAHGQAIFHFAVDSLGITSNWKVEKSIYPQIDTMLLNILKDLNPWNPALKNGNPVNSACTINLKILFHKVRWAGLSSGFEVGPGEDYNDDKIDGTQSAFYKAGLDLSDKGDYEAAAKKFSNATIYDDKCKDCFFNEGICYLKAGKKEKACVAFKKGMDLGDNEATKLYNKYCQ